MISIIIPLYNKEKQIAQTLQSVFKQTYQSFEIIIIDDGSTDNSVEEVKKIADTRIRIIHQENAGVSAARNRGIEEAKNELIAFLDADDKWKSTYLETQYTLYKKYPKCSVYACNYEFQDSNGKIVPTIINRLYFKENDGELTNYFEATSHSHPLLWTSAIMVKKKAIKDIKGFPLGIKLGEDLLTWAKLAVKYKIAFCKIPLAVYTVDPLLSNEDQKQRVPEKKDIVGEELMRLYKENHNIKGLKKYNALWHKMRCKIFLYKNNRIEALKECHLSMTFHFSIKTTVFAALIFMPHFIVNKLIKCNK